MTESSNSFSSLLMCPRIQTWELPCSTFFNDVGGGNTFFNDMSENINYVFIKISDDR